MGFILETIEVSRDGVDMVINKEDKQKNDKVKGEKKKDIKKADKK